MQVKPSLVFKILSPKTEIGYNAASDVIQIKKTFLGISWRRIITDSDVVDNVVSKWVTYGDWSVV